MNKRKSIKKEVLVRGVRQSDGNETFIRFLPGKLGLWVKYKNQLEPINPYLMNSNEKRFTNSLVIGGEIVTMVEHVFSAVNGLGIDDIVIEFESNEAPFYANSEIFSRLLYENILISDDRNKQVYRIKKPFKIKGENGQYCNVLPDHDFKINMTIEFPKPIGKQSLSYSFTQDDYLDTVSYARSFLTFEIEDLENPWDQFGKHFDIFPAILPKDPRKSPYITYTNKEFLTALKDPLEPVRHKLLDFIGDLMFLGNIPLGRFDIYKPGHSFNRKIVDTLFYSSISYNLQFQYFLMKIPEMKNLEKYTENNIVHKNEDVLSHTKNVVKNTMDTVDEHNIKFSKKQMLKLLLVAFLHDYGKKETYFIDKNGATSCTGHEAVSMNCISNENLLNRFGLDKRDRDWILNLIKNHTKLHCCFDKNDKNTEENFIQFKNGHKDDYLEYLVFSIADLKGTFFQSYNKEEYNRRMNYLYNELKKVLSECCFE